MHIASMAVELRGDDYSDEPLGEKLRNRAVRCKMG